MNKAFGFGNLDIGRQNTPSGFTLDGSGGGQQWDPAQASPGAAGRELHQEHLRLRPRRLRAVQPPDQQRQGATNNRFYLPGNFYQIQDKVVSTVGELTTKMGSAYNDFRVTYQRERDVRGDQDDFSPFPYVRVDMPDNNFITLGTENSSRANKLNQTSSRSTTT